MRKRGYREAYKKYYGPIPVDSEGRSYDIHHDDGDKMNNHPWNLLAVPIETHYWIHWLQGDWGACQSIALRLKASPNLLSLLNQKRLQDGTHNWLDGETSRQIQLKRLANGTHHFLDKEWQKAKGKTASERFKRMRAAGIHPSQKQWKCLCCGKEGKGSTNAKRWHFDNCKHKNKKVA